MSQKKHCAVCNSVVKKVEGFFTITGSSTGNVFQLQELYGTDYDKDDENNKMTEMTKMTGNPFYARQKGSGRAIYYVI